MRVTPHRRPRVISTLVGAGLLAASLVSLAGGQSPAVAAAGPSNAALGIASGGSLASESPAQQESYLAAAQDLGATWMRIDFPWTDIQRSNASTYDWARYDTLIARAAAHGIQIVGTLAYPPAWARDPSCAGSQYCKPKDAATYATFAGQAAARYGPRGVHHWEIWNEPNLAQWFKPVPDPVFYTRMLDQAYAAIHAADPQGVVITGGTSPIVSASTDIPAIDFVTKIYSAGAKNRFDALGHHPYCFAGSFDCPNTNQNWSSWSQMAATPVSLRSVMAANGDSAKPIWGTEFGAPTAGNSTAVTEAHQAKMLGDAVKTWSTYSWTQGPLFLYSLKDRGTNPGVMDDWFGVLRADGSRKPSYATLQAALKSAPAAAPAPATQAPAPTTQAPTIQAPVPVTTVPTTQAPAPTTQAPTAKAPVTTPPPAPTTPAPVQTTPPAVVPTTPAQAPTTTPARATTPPVTATKKPARVRTSPRATKPPSVAKPPSVSIGTTDPWAAFWAWLRLYRA